MRLPHQICLSKVESAAELPGAKLYWGCEGLLGREAHGRVLLLCVTYSHIMLTEMILNRVVAVLLWLLHSSMQYRGAIVMVTCECKFVHYGVRNRLCWVV